MKKVVFVTNLPSPYRVDFFNELGKKCELIVVYERFSSAERNEKWKGKPALNYKEIYSQSKPKGVDQSTGNRVKRIVSKIEYDVLIITGYSSPSIINLILYCKLHKKPYFIEYDGGFYKKDNLLKKIIKQFLLKDAVGHLTTCDEHITYLKSLNIKQQKIFKYPFSSITENDILCSVVPLDEKKKIKQSLGIKETIVVLAVGQFIFRKGFDILLHAATLINDGIGIYIVGDNPTAEFLSIVEKNNLRNIHFVGFKTKKELEQYYKSSDIFVHPTREDIWGLVINEAMGYGLPVITTKRCNAGLELINDGENGFIIETDNIDELGDSINKALELRHFMGKNALAKIKSYTIEKMVEAHISFLL